MGKKISLLFKIFVFCFYFNVGIGSDAQNDQDWLAELQERDRIRFAELQERDRIRFARLTQRFLNPSRTFAQNSEQIEDVVNDTGELLSTFAIRNDTFEKGLERIVNFKQNQSIDVVSQDGKAIQSRGVFTLDESGLEIGLPIYCRDKPVVMLYGKLGSSGGSDIAMAFFPRYRTVFYEVTRIRSH